MFNRKLDPNFLSQFKEARLLQNLCSTLTDSFDSLYDYIEEAFEMLEIDKCAGVWLDNLGKLIGIDRPTIPADSEFLFTDDFLRSIDTGLHYVEGALDLTNLVLLAGDDYYRKLIKSQIIKNNMVSYGINDLERIAQLIFSNDILKIFYIEKINITNKIFNINVHVNQDLSHANKAFLISTHFDKNGLELYNFPWAPNIKILNLIEED